MARRLLRRLFGATLDDGERPWFGDVDHAHPTSARGTSRRRGESRTGEEHVDRKIGHECDELVLGQSRVERSEGAR
jgi:hypothetical protein